jgi:hypothetical protein
VVRADERTRTADLTSLRVIIHVLLGLAGVCRSCISRPIYCLCLAQCCTVLRSRVVSEWYQEERQLQSDGRSNDTDPRPSEPQSADTCFQALPHVAKAAYLS